MKGFVRAPRNGNFIVVYISCLIGFILPICIPRRYCWIPSNKWLNAHTIKYRIIKIPVPIEVVNFSISSCRIGTIIYRSSPKGLPSLNCIEHVIPLLFLGKHRNVGVEAYTIFLFPSSFSTVFCGHNDNSITCPRSINGRGRCIL